MVPVPKLNGRYMLLNEDRLFPADPTTRALARDIYERIKSLPIISPHGHVDPAWLANNEPFADATELFIIPDHYVTRMLVSQGVPLDQLGVPRRDGTRGEADNRRVWRLFAQNYHLFRATPSRMWLDHVFQNMFGMKKRLSAETADTYYDAINERLAMPGFRPRALFEQFNIEVLATTESPLDDLRHHKKMRADGWDARVVTTYRPDAVIDPETTDFAGNIERLSNMSGCDATTWPGYLEAHRRRRAAFREMGATATDHGHANARTETLSDVEAAALFDKALTGTCNPEETDRFRGHMLTEMARMSLDDGMVMQLHPGSVRNHSPGIFAEFGADKGFDIPARADYVRALKPLLDEMGMNPDFRLILFTLDETAMSRELAPLAGVYPCLRLGPAWWFFDSAEGMRRYREIVTETAGFYNSVGFNDDTRALCSIPARHDVARRVDAAFLAEQVVTGRLDEEEAHVVAHDLTYALAKEAYRL